jgi:hypothetical protein
MDGGSGGNIIVIWNVRHVDNNVISVKGDCERSGESNCEEGRSKQWGKDRVIIDHK